MIVSTTDSEEQAFDKFFNLLDEHSVRDARLIAEILNPTSNTRTVRDGVEIQVSPPKRVQLVKYTDDPGFFALHESEEWTDGFYPYLSWLSGTVGGQFIVYDKTQYDELLRQNLEWEQNVDSQDTKETA